MKAQTVTPIESTIAAALKAAERARGWNGRNPVIRRFDLGACLLIVVPARRWAYRRIERQAQIWQDERDRAT